MLAFLNKEDETMQGIFSIRKFMLIQITMVATLVCVSVDPAIAAEANPSDPLYDAFLVFLGGVVSGAVG